MGPETMDTIRRLMLGAWRLETFLSFASGIVWIAGWYILYKITRLRFLQIIIAGEAISLIYMVVLYQHYVTGHPANPSFRTIAFLALLEQTLRLLSIALMFVGGYMGLKHLQRKWNDLKVSQQTVRGDSGTPAEDGTASGPPQP